MNIENVTSVTASIVAVAGALSATTLWSYRLGRTRTQAETDKNLQLMKARIGDLRARVEDLRMRLAALDED